MERFRGRAKLRVKEGISEKERKRKDQVLDFRFRGKDGSPWIFLSMEKTISFGFSVFAEKASFGWELSDRNAYEGRTVGVALMRSAGPILNYMVIF